MSINYTAPGFEPTTFQHEVSHITTRPFLPSCMCCYINSMAALHRLTIALGHVLKHASPTRPLCEKNYYLQSKRPAYGREHSLWIQPLWLCLINNRFTCSTKSKPVKLEVSDTSPYEGSECSLPIDSSAQGGTFSLNLQVPKFKLGCVSVLGYF